MNNATTTAVTMAENHGQNGQFSDATTTTNNEYYNLQMVNTKGILLHGAPGVGKTFAAFKALELIPQALMQGLVAQGQNDSTTPTTPHHLTNSQQRLILRPTQLTHPVLVKDNIKYQDQHHPPPTRLTQPRIAISSSTTTHHHANHLTIYQPPHHHPIYNYIYNSIPALDSARNNNNDIE